MFVTPSRSSLGRSCIAIAFVGMLALACGGDPEPIPPTADPSSERMLPSGKIVGFTGGYGSHVWLGVPFAAPPVGADRWRAPRAAGRWVGTREALSFGSPCAQIASPFAGVVDQEAGTFAGSEDCLYLNVYAPRLEPGSVPAPGKGTQLPVMVWIHGGGNVVGHASFYDGGNLAQLQDVVVVSVNYRLGPLGWFRHASLGNTAAGTREASGNFGNLDQIRALAWVRENIAAFGGDPGNVTIFGESAGGRDVLALLLSPLAKGFFHRAIVQSGSARPLFAADAEDFTDAPAPGHENSSNETIVRLMIADGSARDRAAAKQRIASLSDSDLAAYLRSLSAEALLDTYTTDAAESLPWVPNVFADGVVLPEGPPLEVLASGRFNRVPVMLGTNKHESRTFMFADPEYVTRWFNVLPRLQDEDRYTGTADAHTNAWKLVGADLPADAMVRAGAKDVYVYRWDWDEEPSILGSDLGVLIGAGHGFEIPFIFGHYDLGPEGNIVWTDDNAPGREELSAAMMSYWTEFARSGRPGRGRQGDLPEWLPRSQGPQIVLDTSEGGGVRMDSERLDAPQVIARIQSDSRLQQEDRCAVAADVSEQLEWTNSAPLVALSDCSPAVASAP